MCLRCVTYFRIPSKRLAYNTFEPAESKNDLPQSRKTRFTHVESSRKKEAPPFFGGDTSLLGALSSASGLLLCAEALALFANVVSQ